MFDVIVIVVRIYYNGKHGRKVWLWLLKLLSIRHLYILGLDPIRVETRGQCSETPMVNYEQTATDSNKNLKDSIIDEQYQKTATQKDCSRDASHEWEHLAIFLDRLLLVVHAVIWVLGSFRVI